MSLVVFFMSFIPRLLYWLLNPPDPRSFFSTIYWRLSEGLLKNGTLSVNGRVTTTVEPVYPLFLAVIRKLTQDRLTLVMAVQWAVCSIGAVYLYKLTLLLSRDRRAAILAAAYYSFYPYLIHQSVRVIEIPILMTLLVIATYRYCRVENPRSSLSCGFTLGLTILARAALLPLWIGAVVFLLLKKRVLHACLAAWAAALVITPFWFWSYTRSGALLPTRAGWDLFKGNCEYSDKVIPFYATDLLNSYVSGVLVRERPDLLSAGRAGEKAIDEFYRDKAIQFMKTHPARTFKLKLRNIAYFLSPRIIPYYPLNASPRPPAVEWLHAAFSGFILITAAAGMYFRRKEWEKDFLLYWTLALYLITYSVFCPSTRHRVSMDFIFMFYSACAVRRLAGNWALTTKAVVLN